MKMPEKPTPAPCRTSSFSAADFLARLSALQEPEKDSEIHAALSSLNWPGWLKPGSLRILHDIQTGESTKPNLQEQLEQTQQEFDRLLEMSLDFDEDTPFLDDKMKKLNSKIKHLKKVIADSAARQEKVRQPEMLLSAKDLQIQEYDDALTARVIEKITVRFRNEIEIRFIGGCQKTMQLK